ncbi:MAG: HAMP domain-containing protein [Granulosicoccus sp.]
MARSSDSNFLVALFRDKTLQAREIRRVIGISLIYLIATTVLVGLFYHQLLGRLLDGMAPLLFVSEDMALANEAVPALGAVLTKWLVAMLVINAVITFCLGIYISRNLGRPILAIKRALNEIGNGNLDVKLRSTDSKEFSEICMALNKAMHSIRLQIGAAKENVTEATRLQKASTEAQNVTHNGELDIVLDNCREALEYFQTEGTDPEFTLVDIDDDSNSHKVA